MFYKFINKVKADELTAVGFKYTVEYIDGCKVYSFFTNPELEKYIHSNFSKGDFFINKTMKFNQEGGQNAER